MDDITKDVTGKQHNEQRNAKMILAEKKTTVGGTMRLVVGMDDGVVEYITIHQGVQVNFGLNQAEAWAWFNSTTGVE